MLIQAKEIRFGYDDKVIIDTTSLDIGEEDRIGLVGANGEGKTTLLNVLLKNYRPDDGEVNFKGYLSFGFLKQSDGLNSQLTVYKEMESVFSDVFEAENKIRSIENKMSGVAHDSAEYKSLLGEYDRCNAYFEAKDGYNVAVRIKSVLNGMGFEDRYDSIICDMSGGEKTRLAICKLLLINPELLVLDEPTNHLDFETLTWLEKHLESYKGALLIVSHDRYFLDKTVTKIWDLEDKRVSVYNGNFSKYKQLKKECVERQLKEYERQSRKIESMTEYAERNICRASTSNMAKSRLHQLANMERVEKPITYRKQPKFTFTYETEPVKEVLTVKNFKLAIGDRVLIDDIDLKVYKGERLAIIGANGTGKTTFIRTLIKDRFETYGKIIFGKWTKIGYYDQENLNLDFDESVIDELWGKYHRLNQTEVRKILARMLLFEDDIHKKVRMLSGGERAKLGFALLIAEHGNVLILDEPTNHLDLDSREALEDGLKEFAGTIIFVSHDRYFINSIATRTLEFEDCKAVEYSGGYNSYLEQKSEQKQAVTSEVKVAKERKSGEYRTAKDRSVEVGLKNAIKNAEARINALNEELSVLYNEIQTTEVIGDYVLMKLKCDRIEQIKSELDTVELEYLEKSEEYSSIFG
ncbi:MAG: ABC-F family ATP-binding cassette domain-containing protein [Clostridia bacterium]|nr:ABC-F family ATP-binding cassette domain-containing protein [Clostridia bacterium]